MKHGTDFYFVGEWSIRLCAGQGVAFGHNLNGASVAWTGRMGKQATGTLTCACGATRRVIQYAHKAR